MKHNNELILHNTIPVTVCNGGLFVSRGKGMHPHRTIDSYELIFVDRGILGMYEENTEFRVCQGEALLLFPGRKHGGTDPYPADLRFYWIHFTFDKRDKKFKTDSIAVPKHTGVKRHEKIVELYRYFLDNQEAGSGNSPGSNLLCMLILAEVAAQSSARDDSEGASHLAMKSQMCIKEHLHENISTSDIAKMLKCNPDYLGRIHKKTFGITLTDAIHRERTRRSCDMLLHSDMNINEIAYECGFQDPGYFRRVFRRIMGISPGKYRKMYSRVHINTE